MSTKTMFRRPLWSHVLTAGLAAAGLTLATLTTVPAMAAPSPVQVFVPPAGTDGAFGVTTGPGGTYFAHGATIDRVADGRITEFALPDPAAADAGWLTWPGGQYLWFADRGTGRVGTITASGAVHEYQLPAGTDGHAAAQGLVVGPGPYLWATDYLNGQIDRLDTRTGAVHVYPIPTPESGPVGMVRGPDGALWFVERTTGKLGRLSLRGSFVEWTLPDGAFPNRIIVGPDGRIWFTELGTDQLGRIGSSWRLIQSPLPGGAVGITRGPDGAVYVALNSTGQLARLTGNGAIARTWDLPGSVDGALQVAPSRGRIWVTDPFDDLVFAVAVGRT